MPLWRHDTRLIDLRGGEGWHGPRLRGHAHIRQPRHAHTSVRHATRQIY